MAKMASETIVITVSKLSKNSDSDSVLITEDVMAALEQVLAELVDGSAIVEIERV